MRPTLRLLAAVKPGAAAAAASGARYLEAGTPTGLTGLLTHPSPRSSLIYLYTRTLEKLSTGPSAPPASSLYRRSVEAVTRHRLAVVEAATPPGHAAWAERARKLAAEYPAQFRIAAEAAAFDDPYTRGHGTTVLQTSAGGKADGRLFLRYEAERPPPAEDTRTEEWDGEEDAGPGAEGLRGAEERADLGRAFATKPEQPEDFEWVPEPQLTAEQIEEIENRIGGGLIEEVVDRAQAELDLVDFMCQSKVWEDLEEKPAEGQWTYFERTPTH
ncbi:hypothetical protein GGS23DRAFT_551514 [Durotheca rogersii]|uniref:uncharacterized protein n=1 Tax=Durotheca rogersii TaxID=419775 RepID=UPI00222043BE|nr:uncharacterized protein GGS23DRAFT_551514 [Durotheca rogersii]KAI5866670.1 hypothetical protein GGS23DRAFT_551514 [Durotheca rogersii]